MTVTDYVTLYMGVDAKSRMIIIRKMVNSFQKLNPVWLKEHCVLQEGVLNAGRMLDIAETTLQMEDWGRDLAFVMATVAEVLICGVQVAAHGQNILDVRKKHGDTREQVDKVVRHIKDRLQRLSVRVSGVVKLTRWLKEAEMTEDVEVRLALQKQLQETMVDIDDGDWMINEGDANVMQQVVKKMEGYVKINEIIYVIVVILFVVVVIIFFLQGSYTSWSWAILAISFNMVFLCQVARRQLVGRKKIIMDYQLRKYLFLRALSHVEAILKGDLPFPEDAHGNHDQINTTCTI